MLGLKITVKTLLSVSAGWFLHLHSEFNFFVQKQCKATI